jgi:hypothetical protein
MGFRCDPSQDLIIPPVGNLDGHQEEGSRGLQALRCFEELRIPILTTNIILFETVIRLYSKGIVSCIEKAGE